MASGVGSVSWTSKSLIFVFGTVPRYSLNNVIFDVQICYGTLTPSTLAQHIDIDRNRGKQQRDRLVVTGYQKAHGPSDELYPKRNCTVPFGGPPFRMPQSFNKLKITPTERWRSTGHHSQSVGEKTDVYIN